MEPRGLGAHGLIVKKKVYLYWISLSATKAALPRGLVRGTPHGSSVVTAGSRSTGRKPGVLGRIKLNNTLLTCEQGNFNQVIARSRNLIPVTVVRDTCTTTVPPSTSFLPSNTTQGKIWLI